MTGARPTLDVIALGEAMVELWADRPLGESDTLHRSWGGDVLNALVTVSSLRGRTGLITRVGNDPFGPDLLRLCREYGVDTACAPLVPGENGVYFISLDPESEREFTYRRAGSAASTLAPEQLDTAYLTSARTLLLSGITQAISGTAQAATLEAARIARAAGVTVAFDPNYRSVLWAARGGARAAQAAWQGLAPFVDVLLPSFPADLPALDLTELDSPEATVTRLRGQVPRVALKAAERGAYLLGPEGECHVPTAPVAVVDSTGAGDAWNGAFLLGLARGVAPYDAARQAHRASAEVLTQHGGLFPHPAQEIS